MIVATQKQQDFIESLCADLGCSTRAQRNDLISGILKREIKYLDEIAKAEASNLISELLVRKENLEGQESDYDPREDYRK